MTWICSNLYLIINWLYWCPCLVNMWFSYVMCVGLWVVVKNLLRTSINWSSVWCVTWVSSKQWMQYSQKWITKASMLSNFLWNTQLSWTCGAWYKSPISMTSIFPKKWLCVCLMDLRQRLIKENILLPMRETSSNTTSCSSSQVFDKELNLSIDKDCKC